MAKRIETNRIQVFRLIAPTAREVLLVGDFTHWRERPVHMEKGADGAWTAVVGLAPGKHAYLFIVDGQWRDDPGCTQRAPNSFGGFNMVRDVA